MNSPLPLSPLQERMWLAEQTTLSARENVFGLLKFDVELTADVIRRSIDSVFRRQSALRTQLRYTSNGVEQFVTNDLPVLAVDDVDAFLHCQRAAEQVASTRIELLGGPLWRMRLMKAGRYHYLAFAFHHIVVDGWSLNVFVEDLESALRHELGSEHAQAAVPDEWTHSAMISRQIEERNSAIWASSLSYWRSSMPAERPSLVMPTSLTNPEESDGSGESFSRLIAASDWKLLTTFARNQRTTVFAALASVVSSSLSQLAEVREGPIVLGVPFHRRDNRASRRTITYVANMVPIVLHNSEGGSQGAIRSARQALAGGFSHGQIPPEEVAETCYGSDSLPYEFCLNMKMPVRNGSNIDRPMVSSLSIGNDAANFDYELFVAPQEEGARASLCWDSRKLAPKDAELLWATFISDLRNV